MNQFVCISKICFIEKHPGFVGGLQDIIQSLNVKGLNSLSPLSLLQIQSSCLVIVSVSSYHFTAEVVLLGGISVRENIKKKTNV